MLTTIILNPAAPRAALLRAQLPAISALLLAHGQTARVIETLPDAAATRTITQSALQTSSVILACGGDGTIHDVMQAIADNGGQRGVTLGIVPIGTANALARNLDLPLDPLAAVRQLLSYTPQIVPVGEAETATSRRYFLTMAGCGPDGALAHVLADAARTKALFGRSAYYAHAARLFFTRRWPAFRVEFRAVDSSHWQATTAVALMVARVPDLGGLFAGLTPRAALTDDHLHLHLLRPPAQLALPAWFAHARIGVPNPWLNELNVAEVRCSALSPRPVYIQADAEPLGALPLCLRVIPNALSVLMPPR